MGDWQGCVNDTIIGSGYASSAAIVTLKGECLARNGPIQLFPDEIPQILRRLCDIDEARLVGVHIGGEKYVVLRATPGYLILRKGNGGGCIAQSQQAFVMGLYDQKKTDTNPADCNAIVEFVANYLKQNGY